VEWTNDHREWYRTVYLKSDHWAALKKAKLRVSSNCEVCGSQKKMDIHHINYRNIFDVTTDDLATLCRKCHTEWHEKHGMPVRDKVSFESYLPLPARMVLELRELRRRKASESSKITVSITRGLTILTKTGLGEFNEALSDLFDGKCFNCGTVLAKDNIFTIRRKGTGGGITGKLLACGNCAMLGSEIRKIIQTPEIVSKLQNVQTEVVNRRIAAACNFRRKLETPGYDVFHSWEKRKIPIPVIRIPQNEPT